MRTINIELHEEGSRLVEWRAGSIASASASVSASEPRRAALGGRLLGARFLCQLLLVLISSVVVAGTEWSLPETVWHSVEDKSSKSAIETTAQLEQQLSPETQSLSSRTNARKPQLDIAVPTARSHRQRRHTAPGTLELQETKRKAAGPAESRGHTRQVIHAILKGRAVLTCDLKPPEPDDAVSLVLWYKDKSMVPIYSLDARSSSIEEARHKPGPWLESRASLKIVDRLQRVTRAAQRRNNDTSSRHDSFHLRRAYKSHKSRTRVSGIRSDSGGGRWARFAGSQELEEPGGSWPQAEPVTFRAEQQLEAHLHIESLSSEDNGLYLCRVDFRRARSRTQESVLKIVVPADKPIVRDLSVGQVDTSRPVESRALGSVQVFGPHNEGAKIVLECETQGGYPEPLVTWWRDGRLVDDSYEVVSATDGLLLSQLTAISGPGASLEGAPVSLAEFKARVRLDGSQEAPGGSEGERDSFRDALVVGAASGKEVTQNRLIRNRLELNGLARADLLANYSCQAWNTKLSEPPTSLIMIDMNLRPIGVQIDNERAPVLADKPLELVCRAFGSRPAALVTWWRAGTKLTASNHSQLPARQHSPNTSRESFLQLRIQELQSTDSNVTSSTLSFIPQPDDAGQIISCRAQNPYIQSQPHDLSSTIEDTWKLDVHYLPRVRLALGDKLSAPIQEGHDVYFECTLQAHPSVSEIRWWFEGKELETNLTSGIIISNQSLVLQRVNRHQRGRYTCSAINSVGESHSNSLHLRVQYAPFCRDNHQDPQIQTQNDPFTAISQQKFKTHYGAARMEPVRVFCHVDADPIESISYKWAFVASSAKYITKNPSPSSHKPEFTGQQLVYLDSNSLGASDAENPLVGVVKYTPRSDSDYGTLLCWASNSIGQQSEPCVYQVVPAERPDPVRNCHLVNATESQLVVGCEPGYDGGVDQSFQMEVYDSQKRRLVANVSSLAPEGGDKLKTTNNYFIMSHNDLGNSTSSSQDDQLDDDPLGQQPESDSLVSAEALGTRQQKQRHSQQLKSANTLWPEQNENHKRASLAETLFMTEPNLRPATDYFLSIYSTNSKGSSKPVAFTVTTLNLSSNQFDSLASSSRDARRTDPSHLFTEVLSLSWSPFILVCAITLVLFLLFVSITFAMMKYVDFSAHFSSASAQSLSGYDGACLSSGVSIATSKQESQLEHRDQVQGSGKRAQVITLTSANSSILSRDRVQLRRNDKRASLVTNGSYLKFKIQQKQHHKASLKQSNSDNFLNLLGASRGSQPKQSQESALSSGTLPKNLSILRRPLPSSDCSSFTNLYRQSNYEPGSDAKQAVQSVPLEPSENSDSLPADQFPVRPPSALAALTLAGPVPYMSGYPMGEARVEQLIISGKQYIHQTSAPGANLYHQTQQPQFGPKHFHHLPVTGKLAGPAHGSVGGSNLYEVHSMKNYQELVHNPDHIQKAPLICINQRGFGLDGACPSEAQSGSQTLVSYAATGANGELNCSGCDNGGLSKPATKTSDLGDEIQIQEPNETNNNGSMCRFTHLAPIEHEGTNMDSDGMSSGTQKSFTTNGSPSSGIAEMDNRQVHFQHHFQTQHPNQNYQVTSLGPSGSITSDHQQGTELVGTGNAINILHQCQPTLTDIQMLYPSTLSRKPGGVSRTNINAKVQDLPTRKQDSLANLDQYTMYLNNLGDANNNPQNLEQFYVLPTSTIGLQASNAHRVRIVSHAGNNDQQAAIQQLLPFNYPTSVGSNPGEQSTLAIVNGADLHTDL